MSPMAVTSPAVPATTVAQPNTTGQLVDVAVTGGTITGILVLPNPAQPLVAPAIPASTVQTVNNTGQPVAVTVTGGTVTVIAVGGVTSGITAGTVIVPAGGNIAITYSVVPTSWTWQQAVGGFHGTGIPNPSSVSVPPAAAITLVYSVAPTWAWTNPMQGNGYTPYAPAINSVQGSQIAQLPYPAHAEGGLTGLAVAVSN
jgi:hypothetical protein